MHRHTVINGILTSLSNWLTDLNLTDMETAYKAINTTLFKSMPIRSNDFRFEVEIVSRLAKRRARVFDEYGSDILVELERARRFNLWLGQTLRPYIGDRVPEIGAGRKLSSRMRQSASDICESPT